MDSNNDSGAGGELGAETPAPASPAPEQGEKNTVVLSRDHFPEGMAVKDGDKLTFCVTGEPDSEGNVSGYFEAGGEGKPAEDDWEAGFRKEMSPTASQEGAE